MSIKQITIKQLAELAGVSRGTVDKVLHNRPGVKASTKKEVLNIAETMNYQPNIIGKALVSKTPIELGIILTPEYNPFIGEMLEGIRMAEQEFSVFNVNVSVHMPVSLEPIEQISILNTLKQNGTQGIAVFPFDDEQVVSLVNSFVDEGIPIITVNSRVEEINCLSFIGQNHEKGGATAAGLFNKLLPGGGDVGIILSSYNLSCHNERLFGFKNKISDSKSRINIVSEQENQDRDDKAFEITLDYCKKYPNLAGIYITSGGVVGCAKALKIVDKNNRIKLICHDVTPPVKGLLADGVLDFVINQSPQIQGYQLVKILFEYLVKKQQPASWFEVPIEIVTEDIL